VKLWEIIENKLFGGPGSGNWGHAGRPGKRGGSVPRSAGMSIKSGPDWEARFHKARGEEFGYGTTEGLQFHGNRPETRFITRGENTDDWKVRGDAKDTIATELSERTGIPYEDINQVIRQWSWSANDKDYRSLCIQEAISKEFGVPLSGWQKSLIAEFGKDWKDPVKRKVINEYAHISRELEEFKNSHVYGTVEYQKGVVEIGAKKEAAYANLVAQGVQYSHGNRSHVLSTRVDPEGDLRKVVRAMYDYTQEELKARGVKELTVHRGTSLSSITQVKQRYGYWGSRTYPRERDQVVPESNTASSWSSRTSTTKKFGEIRISMKIPASRVLASARTGFGCLSEQEYIILGSSNDRAEVIGRN